MAFFGYFKKGFQIGMLKGDVAEEVASDEDAFLPGLVILLLPPLVMGLLIYLAMGLFMGVSEGTGDPQLEMLMSAYGDTMKGMSISFIFLLPLLALVGQLIYLGILHLLAKLLKGEGGFLDYFQTVCVAGIITWLSYIPYIGFLFSLWFIVVLIVVTARVHGFGIGKAVVVVLLPIIVIVVIGLALVGMMIPAMMAAGGAAHPM